MQSILNKVIILPLILILLGLVMKPFAPYFEYQINKELIIEKYCINKSKPKLNCNGKCYLSQQLKKAAEKEKEPMAPMEIEKIEWVVAIVPKSPAATFDSPGSNRLFPGIMGSFYNIDLPPPTPPPPRRS